MSCELLVWWCWVELTCDLLAAHFGPSRLSQSSSHEAEFTMESIQNKVHYCCVSKANHILYAYNGGDQQLETLATLCLEKAPPFHSFLEHLRDEYRKLARKASRGKSQNPNSTHIQEKLLPVIHNLITSLESVSHGTNWRDRNSSSFHPNLSPSPSNLNGQIEGASSTKAPLLGKSSKPEKKKIKDHVIAMRDVELEEHRKSTDRGPKADSGNLDCIGQGGAGASASLQKDMGSMRMRTGPQNIRKKWWRQVRIVLAIDAAVCIMLFIIWLFICHGLSCIR
ncbi:hypothetical protein PIB30_033505 [Stylosanthes scabra]|uniref:VAMP-like protein n=1 Tax=Stylosanthes scabra TaxID=79078 RepID=A0ABU6QC13_9FABA|nr:hypothetical protein [Stylosanthes scabra]